MSNVIAALIPDAGTSASGNRQTDRQTDADNQRQAWLRQMEMSQISLLQQAGAHDDRPSMGNQAQSNSAWNEPQQPDRNKNAPNQEASQVTLLPVHSIPQQGHETADVEHQPGQAVTQPDSVTTASSTESGAGIPASVAGQTASPLSQGAGSPASIESSANSVASAVNKAAQAALQQVSNEATTAGLAGTPAAAANSVAVAVAVTQQTIESGAESAQPVVAPTVEGRVATMATGLLEPSNPQSEETDEAGEVQHQSANADPAGSTGDAWQKRLLHVAQDGQDLSVSIRDSSLDAGRAVIIVNRLAADAAQAGLKLGNATVNGKTILKQPKAGNGNRQPDSKAAAAMVSGIAADAPAAQFPFQEINDSNTIEEQQDGA